MGGGLARKRLNLHQLFFFLKLTQFLDITAPQKKILSSFDRYRNLLLEFFQTGIKNTL